MATSTQRRRRLAQRRAWLADLLHRKAVVEVAHARRDVDAAAGRLQAETEAASAEHAAIVAEAERARGLQAAWLDALDGSRQAWHQRQQDAARRLDQARQRLDHHEHLCDRSRSRLHTAERVARRIERDWQVAVAVTHQAELDELAVQRAARS